MTRRVAVLEVPKLRALVNARTTEFMGKKTPDVSRLSRANALPYTLRKTDASDKNFVVAKSDKTKTEAKETGAPKPGDGPKSATHNESPVPIEVSEVREKTGPMPADAPKGEAPKLDDTPHPGDGPKSATHNELPTERAHTETIGMPFSVGAPPAMPAGTVEDPTNMPGAKDVPKGSPTDAALPPGHVPPGDSRSLRRGNEFALIYRQGNAVISRFGVVGQRGQWRVVEYPTSSSASHSYAKECSRFVAEGFSDYRD